MYTTTERSRGSGAPVRARAPAASPFRAARLRRREARVLGLRLAGYSRDEIVELTGESHRTIDRELGRARRTLRDALQAAPAIG